MPKIYTVLTKARALSSAIEKKWRKTPKSKFTSMLLERPPTFNLQKESAAKIARRIESKSHISLTNKIESAFNRTLQKPGKGNQRAKLIAQKNRALTKAFTLSLKRGQKAGEKTMTKFGYEKGSFFSSVKDRPKSYFKAQKQFKRSGFGVMTEEEGRALGFPPREPMSAAKKYALAKNKKFEPVNKPFYYIDPSSRKVKQIDRFKAVRGTYFRPSTQRFELRKKPKKRK